MKHKRSVKIQEVKEISNKCKELKKGKYLQKTLVTKAE